MRNNRPVRASVCSSLASLVLCLAPAARAQNQVDTLADVLRQRLSKDKVLITNFSAEPVVHAQAHNSGVVFAGTQRKSFSLMQFTKVTTSGQRINLYGNKKYLLRDVADKLATFPEVEPVTLTVDLDPDLTQDALQAIPAALFFSAVSEAFLAVPKDAASLVPGQVASINRDPPKENKGTPPVQAACDCSQRGTAACLAGDPGNGSSLPALVRRAELRLPDGTPPNSHFKTSSTMKIAPNGHVGEIWMLYASNAGVASSTFDSLSRSQFTPAKCHNSPVESYITTDLRFYKY